MEYIKKTLQAALFGITYNKVFILLLLLACILLPFGAEVINYSSLLNMNMTVSIGLGVLLPLIMFSYIQKRTEFNFYSAMPIKRSQYFIGYCLSSTAIFIAVYIVGNIIGYYADPHHQGYLAGGILMYLIAFASTTFAIMLSGSFLSTLVTFALTNIYVYVTAMEILALSNVRIYCYTDIIKPVLYAFTPFSAVESIYDSYGNEYYVIPTLIMAGVQMVISFFLFCKRKSEISTALAFPKTGLLYRYAAMFLASLCMVATSAYSWQEQGEKSYSGFLNGFFTASSLLYSVLTALVVFIVMNMVLEGTPRAAFKKIRHYFIFIGGYLVFICTIGGLLYSSLPYSMIPYRADVVLINVCRYEEKARFIFYEELYFYDSDTCYVYGNGETSWTITNKDGVITYTDEDGNPFDIDSYTYDAPEGVEIYDNVELFYDEELEKYEELANEDWDWVYEYENLGTRTILHFYCKEPVALYYTDDPLCIDMLSDNVKNGLSTQSNRGILGYGLTGVFGDEFMRGEQVIDLRDIERENGLHAEIGFYRTRAEDKLNTLLESIDKNVVFTYDRTIVTTLISSEESLDVLSEYDVKALEAGILKSMYL